MKVNLTVNGDPYQRTVEGGETLLSILREDLDLTGTKWGCLTGDCGACTVIVNDRAITSCLQAVGQLDDSSITTIEGIAPRGEQMNDMQESFVRNGAAQCGFCTPGMVVCAEQLVRDGVGPDELAIREGLAGNLCRCTGYNKIIDSVVEVARSRKT